MEERDQAVAEIRSVLEGVARREKTIFYSDLTPQIKAIYLEPGGDLLAELLDAVSRQSDTARRVMLSAVVIRKGEEPLPGPGFFKLARELGRSVGTELSDRLALHTLELKRVYASYAL
jgi:hypothetical protein